MLSPTCIESLEARQFLTTVTLDNRAVPKPRPLPAVTARPRVITGAAPSFVGRYEGRVNYVRGAKDDVGVHEAVLRLDTATAKRAAGVLTVKGVGSFRIVGTVAKDGTFDFGFAKNDGFFRGQFKQTRRVVAGMCIFIDGVEHAGQIRLGPTPTPGPDPNPDPDPDPDPDPGVCPDT
jgi:hypothetical protein